MKTIYFIRHAKSSWDDVSLADHDRPLNARGKRDAPAMARRLAGFDVSPDGILSSTAKRTKQTLKNFREALGVPKEKVILNPDLYLASTRGIAQAIRELPAEWDTVLLFGHNPGYTDLANLIPGPAIENVPTCGIVGCRSDIGSWEDFRYKRARRLCFLYPKQVL